MTYQLHHGDCLEILPTLEANSVDSIITDPPYGLEFMGKDWDHGIPGVRFWKEALRVAKPGATLLAFGGTRTFHRLAVAIEDAGWEIRDTMMWVYGSGFPKSHDISKAIDREAGAEREVVGRNPNARNLPPMGVSGNYAAFGRKVDPEKAMEYHQNTDPNITTPATDAAREWDGWGTALKPAWEPIIVAQKPRDGTYANNALQHGVAGLWIDGGRVPTEDDLNGGTYSNGAAELSRKSQVPGNGIGREYKQPPGRWPANLIHDGSDEVVALFPETSSSVRQPSGKDDRGKPGFVMRRLDNRARGHNDSGSAARFFYCAKASRAERNAGLDGMEAVTVDDGRDTPIDNPYQRGKTLRTNSHPTVKPLALMRHLARLTKTPTGGVVLDPFMGSGTTGIAAVLEGRDFIGIEQDADYIEIARRRIEHWREEERQLELL